MFRSRFLRYVFQQCFTAATVLLIMGCGSPADQETPEPGSDSIIIGKPDSIWIGGDTAMPDGDVWSSDGTDADSLLDVRADGTGPYDLTSDLPFDGSPDRTVPDNLQPDLAEVWNPPDVPPDTAPQLCGGITCPTDYPMCVDDQCVCTNYSCPDGTYCSNRMCVPCDQDSRCGPDCVSCASQGLYCSQDGSSAWAVTRHTPVLPIIDVSRTSARAAPMRVCAAPVASSVRGKPRCAPATSVSALPPAALPSSPATDRPVSPAPPPIPTTADHRAWCVPVPPLTASVASASCVTWTPSAGPPVLPVVEGLPCANQTAPAVPSASPTSTVLPTNTVRTSRASRTAQLRDASRTLPSPGRNAERNGPWGGFLHCLRWPGTEKRPPARGTTTISAHS